MKPYRIIRDFMRLGDNDLVARAANVVTGMQDNASFPNPAPALQDLVAASLEFSTALSQSSNGDRHKGAVKNIAKAKLRAVLSNLAYYTASVAQGDKAILISSGFKVSSGTIDPPPVDVINGFRVAHGNNSGQMKLGAVRLKGVNTYSFFYGIADGDKTIYKQVTKTTAKTILSGLEAGKTYNFYMEAIGANEKSVQSVIITKVVS